MVFNNTKVIQARMHFRKDTGALIEVFLLEPFAPADYEQMFQTTGHCSWLCIVGNMKKTANNIAVLNNLSIDYCRYALSVFMSSESETVAAAS